MSTKNRVTGSLSPTNHEILICIVVFPEAHGVPSDGEPGPDAPQVEHGEPGAARHRAVLPLLPGHCGLRYTKKLTGSDFI